MLGVSASPQTESGAARIVVVAEDADVFAGIRRELTECGYFVRSASGIEEGSRLARKYQPQVLLTALRLESGNGVELIRRVSRLSPRTRSILLSFDGSAQNSEEALAAGAVRILSKPLESGELLGAIEFAIECESGFRGCLHGLSLIDLMQMFHLTRRSVRLVVEDGEYFGSVSFRRGDLIDARWRQKEGVEALASLLASTYGTVTSCPLGDTPQTIQGSFDSIVLDTLRRLDEDGAPSERFSSLGAFWRPSSSPPSSFTVVPESLVPSSEEERKTMFCRVVEQARTATLSDAWALEVIDDLETSAHPAAGTAALALALDPATEHIEIISGEKAVGVVLMGNYAAVVSTEPAGLQAGQHFRTQFARFSTMIRLNFRVRKL